jgi:HTH-type transcriptional regulator / antitoxin HigA
VPVADAFPASSTGSKVQQRDIAAELGSESTVSRVLSGKRQLNRHHIARLSRRFHVSPSVFFGKAKK